jgi:hypothetical protein
MNIALRCKIWRVTNLNCRRGCNDNIKTDRIKVVCAAMGFNHLADICKHGQEHSEARKTN